MTNTNQLIEDKVRQAIKQFRINCAHQITSTGGLPDFEKALESSLKELLSQTEQECDKKWRERIESKRKGKDCNNCGQCGYCQDDSIIGCNSVIDDLLNNKLK